MHMEPNRQWHRDCKVGGSPQRSSRHVTSATRERSDAMAETHATTALPPNLAALTSQYPRRKDRRGHELIRGQELLKGSWTSNIKRRRSGRQSEVSLPNL